MVMTRAGGAGVLAYAREFWRGHGDTDMKGQIITTKLTI